MLFRREDGYHSEQQKVVEYYNKTGIKTVQASQLSKQKQQLITIRMIDILFETMHRAEDLRKFFLQSRLHFLNFDH